MNAALVIAAAAMVASVSGAVLRALSAACAAFERSLREESIRTPDFVPEALTREP